MFTKTIIALAVALGTTSGALAMTKAHSANPANDVYKAGRYVGSDPDPFIRSQLQRTAPGGTY